MQCLFYIWSIDCGFPKISPQVEFMGHSPSLGTFLAEAVIGSLTGMGATQWPQNHSAANFTSPQTHIVSKLPAGQANTDLKKQENIAWIQESNLDSPGLT